MVEEIGKKRILIVDDEERNVKLLVGIMRAEGYDYDSAGNGIEAIAKVKSYQPDLIYLDIMMPEMDGLEACRRLKAEPESRMIPIVIVTSLADPESRLQGIEAGANDFLTKPIDISEVLARTRNLLKVKEFHDFQENHKRILEQQVAERTEQLRSGYIDTIIRLTLASEYKDEDTGSHIKRISYYTKELAQLLGQDKEFCDTIFYASPMHDIGKVAIPDAIMLKKGPLDDDEWAVMKTHPTVGAKILENSASPYLRMAVDIAQSHHERWDGKGYPQGLQGEEIPLTARIMNITDQYDALRSRRPYKPAFDHAKTVSIITEGDGRTIPEHFDPKVLAAFKKSAAVFADIFASYQDQDEE